MNYFLNVYKLPILFLSFFLILIPFFYIFNYLYDKLSNHFNFSKIWLIIFTLVYVIMSIILPILIVFKLHDFLSDGKITDIFILNKENETRLVVWFTRIDPANMIDVYTHRLKSFDIYNGRQFGKKNLVIRKHINDYDIWGPFDNNAWGYSKKTGIHFLDLFQPEILFTNKDILCKNPQLGSLIQIAPGSYNSVYDPISHELYIVNAKGIIYKIDTNLNAVFAGEVKKDKIEYHKNYLQEWIIEDIIDSEEKIIHISSENISKNYRTFFSPSIIKNLNEENINIDKTWIMHRSSNDQDADCLISYIKDDGQEINRINIKEIFKNKRAEPCIILFHNGELYIFITIDGYTLSALRTDTEKGNILGRINYFK